jgi:RNA polymerase sigma factor (sigma-70 family)
VSGGEDALLAELLRATAGRDHLAFAELYRMTSGRLYGVARRLLGGQADMASEASQEAYIRIWSSAEQYDTERGKPLHWMLSILRHICLDMRRRSAIRPGGNVDVTTVEIPVPATEGTSPDLERCLGTLEAREANAILLAVHYGLSHAELAQQFAMPLGSIKSVVRRALAKLRHCLEPEARDAAAY